jgi:hypothetical protein
MDTVALVVLKVFDSAEELAEGLDPLEEVTVHSVQELDALREEYGVAGEFPKLVVRVEIGLGWDTARAFLVSNPTDVKVFVKAYRTALEGEEATLVDENGVLVGEARTPEELVRMTAPEFGYPYLVFLTESGQRLGSCKAAMAYLRPPYYENPSMGLPQAPASDTDA